MLEAQSKLLHLYPETLPEALELFKKYPDMVLMGGGQTLLPQWRETTYPKKVLCLNQIKSLRGIEQQGKRLFIGSGVTLAELADSALVQQLVPTLAKLALTMGDCFMRNRGTVVGALCTTTYGNCISTAFLGLNALIHTTERDFFLHEYAQEEPYKIRLNIGEIIKGLSFRTPFITSYQSIRLIPARSALITIYGSKIKNQQFIGIGGKGHRVFRATELETQLKWHNSAQTNDSILQKFLGNQQLLGNNEQEQEYIRAQTKRLLLCLMADFSTPFV